MTRRKIPNRPLNTLNMEDGFGWRLRNARLLNNMTQAELAKRIGGSPGSISMFETGAWNGAHFDVVIKIAKVLDISLDYLAGFTKELGSCPVYEVEACTADNLTKDGSVLP